MSLLPNGSGKIVASVFYHCSLLALLTIALSGCDNATTPSYEEFPTVQQEQRFALDVTKGAAAGYVDDKTCGTCHSELYQSYQSVGMAKSFTTPKAEKFIEDFELPPFFHDKSQRYYQMMRNGDELTFQRWQVDAQGNPINIFKRKVDFILGSGHKTRTYLYRENGGELFQLPIGWYTAEQQWGLQPGYDNSSHSGVTRQVRRQCLFCHNAFPEVPEGEDEHFAPHHFPKELPHGTGCQRCHGPGAEHVKTVMQGAVSLEQIHSTIVNPAKLPVAKRDSVCFQCHMLPSVDLTGVRDMARNDYSFRPGEELNDYMHHVDVVDTKVAKEDRFEINHHAYRLQSSACFTQSAGALTCISCHNPHRKVPKAERAEHYGKVCQSCHDKEHQPPLTDNTDCVSCHMPQRRTQDVVRVVMTDHKIQKNNQGKDWLAPLQEEEPILTSLDFLTPEKSPKGDWGQMYKVITMLQVQVQPNYVDYLQTLLKRLKPEDTRPYMELIRGQLLLKRYRQAQTNAESLLKRDPDNFQTRQWLATALTALGQHEKAELLYQQLFAQRDDVAELYFNYALLKYSQKKPNEALTNLAKTLALRSNMPSAWYYRAKISAQTSEPDKAVEYFKQTLAIDPAFSRAYTELSAILLKKGDKSQAIRYLKVGMQSARQTQEISALLSDLQSTP